MIDDYGVISYYKNNDGLKVPEESSINALNKLSKDPNNIVILVSSKSKFKLHQAFA